MKEKKKAIIKAQVFSWQTNDKITDAYKCNVCYNL